jgi:hypothetical protein
MRTRPLGGLFHCWPLTQNQELTPARSIFLESHAPTSTSVVRLESCVNKVDVAMLTVGTS